MKWIALIILFSCSVSQAASRCEKSMNNVKSIYPSGGFVSKREIALAIAKAILPNALGKNPFENAGPFYADLKDGVWTVYNEPGPEKFGGAYGLEICASDGRILGVEIGK